MNNLLSAACFSSLWNPLLVSNHPPFIAGIHSLQLLQSLPATISVPCLSPSPDRDSQSKESLLVYPAHLGWHRSPSRQEICVLWEMCINSNYHLVSSVSQKFKYEADFMQSRLSRMFSLQRLVSKHLFAPWRIEQPGAPLLSSHKVLRLKKKKNVFLNKNLDKSDTSAKSSPLNESQSACCPLMSYA